LGVHQSCGIDTTPCKLRRRHSPAVDSSHGGDTASPLSIDVEPGQMSTVVWNLHPTQVNSRRTVQALVCSCDLCTQKEVLHGCHDDGSYASDLRHCITTARGVLYRRFARPILAQSRIDPAGLCARCCARLLCLAGVRPRPKPIVATPGKVRGNRAWGEPPHPHPLKPLSSLVAPAPHSPEAGQAYYCITECCRYSLTGQKLASRPSHCERPTLYCAYQFCYYL
jgi:hypothetical protein